MRFSSGVSSPLEKIEKMEGGEKMIKKSFMSLAVVSLLLVCFGGRPAHAYFSFVSNDLTYLNHVAKYTWGIDWTVPANDEITSATLIFNSINNQSERVEPNDVLFIHLLDNPVFLGAHAFADLHPNMIEDDFSGQGVLLTTFEDTNSYYSSGLFRNPAEDFVYSFNQSELSALTDYVSNGRFGFGFDSDCAYEVGRVKFVVGTKLSPVPEPATMSLLGMGVLGLFGLKRRKA